MNDQHEIAKLGGVGILQPSDLRALSKAQQRVRALMIDWKWHTATQIIQVSGQREGLRRMRSLRSFGYVIERKRIGPFSREFVYRLLRIGP